MKYYEILPTRTDTPRNTTRKITNLYIEFNYDFLTLQKKIPLLLNRSVHRVDIWNGFGDVIKSMIKSQRGPWFIPIVNQPIYFQMLRAHIIWICNVGIKILVCTPSPGVFSKCLPPKKYWEAKDWNFHISTSNYQRFTKFTSRYIFFRMTNTMKLVFKKWTYHERPQNPRCSPMLAKQSLILAMKWICHFDITLIMQKYRLLKCQMHL